MLNKSGNALDCKKLPWKYDFVLQESSWLKDCKTKRINVLLGLILMWFFVESVRLSHDRKSTRAILMKKNYDMIIFAQSINRCYLIQLLVVCKMIILIHIFHNIQPFQDIYLYVNHLLRGMLTHIIMLINNIIWYFVSNVYVIICVFK